LRKAGIPEKPPLSLPDKPSVAVLPFTNMSRDPEQAYFADGMTDDLITDLSKISGLFVIARNSTFAYKEKSPDVRQVARELGVKYVLEGSVRRVGDQVRVNAQLIDATTGGHIWAERYDSSLTDIFTLQDRMTRKIVSALAVELTPEEEAQTATRETDNIAAYDAFLQGWAHYNRQTGEEFAKAIEFFERAIDLDPHYATASAALALTYWMGTEFGGLSKILGVSWRELRQRSRKYIDLAMKNPTAISYMVASPAALKQRRYEDAIEYAERAVQLDPNNAEAHRALSYALFYVNRAEEAIESANRAMRLDPGNRAIPLQYIGRAHFALRHYEQAVEFIERARDVNPKVTPHSAMLAAALAQLGRDEEARPALEKYNATWGYTPSVREVMYFWPFKDSDVARRFAEGLVKVGLPPPASGYYVLSDQEQLKADEIRALVFGRTVTGFDPWSGEQWWIKRDADGQSTWRGTAEKSWSGPSVDADRGASRIAGNLLCERWEVQDFQICLPLFRNPEGTKEGKDEYVAIYDTGIYPWSPVE
jgi:TolB-like protein